MKTILSLFILLMVSFHVNSQEKTTQAILISPDAILDLESNDQGVLIPRMDSQQRKNISNPTTGLLVFDSDTKSFWFQDGNSNAGSMGWVELIAGDKDDNDADPTNEIQQLSTNGDTIFISKDGYIVIPGLGNVSLLPDCNDQQMTGTETGVDCGGPFCKSCEERCSDGILNGDEEGIDCGGSSCIPCPTCDDGIKNGDELAVDCGGTECPPCSLIDIIVVVDNSGDMLSEMLEVQSELNSFAATLGAGGVTYRIILITDYPSICVPAPLGGSTCPAGGPVNTANFFHYSETISSTNSLCKILDTYTSADEFNLAPNGWQNWLQPGSIKVFIEVSTDGVNCSTGGTSMSDGDTEPGGDLVAAKFDTALVNLSSTDFGTLGNPKYIFNCIVGIPASADTIVLNTCNTGVNAGTGYQALSFNTGGLRFSTCAPDYAPAFSDIATAIIALAN